MSSLPLVHRFSLAKRSNVTTLFWILSFCVTALGHLPDLFSDGLNVLRCRQFQQLSL